MFQEMLENVRGKCPLIHNITNYVTVNDCANIVLACGASPIMSDDQSEVEEITTICGGLNINIGTLNKRTIESMLLAGKRANALNHPAVLDPVGAGASKLRTETAQKLLEEVKFTVIRGNISEVKTLASGSGTTKGVDADVADKVSEENLDSAVTFAKAFAEKTGAVIAITGAIDGRTPAELAGVLAWLGVVILVRGVLIWARDAASARAAARVEMQLRDRLVAAVGELVQDGVTGRIVPAGRADLFADALADVLADPVRAQAWGRAGRERVCTEFTTDVTGPAMAAFLEGVTG